MSKLADFFRIIIVSSVVSSGVYFVLAQTSPWNPPIMSPPEGNVVEIAGADAQRSLDVSGNLKLSGNLLVGSDFQVAGGLIFNDFEYLIEFVNSNEDVYPTSGGNISPDSGGWIIDYFGGGCARDQWNLNPDSWWDCSGSNARDTCDGDGVRPLGDNRYLNMGGVSDGRIEYYSRPASGFCAPEDNRTCTDSTIFTLMCGGPACTDYWQVVAHRDVSCKPQGRLFFK